MPKKIIVSNRPKKSIPKIKKPRKETKDDVRILSVATPSRPSKQIKAKGSEKIPLKKKQTRDKKILKLLDLLNQPETGCLFWADSFMGSDIIGVRPIERTTKTIINEHGFNPLEQLKNELFSYVYFIKILDSKLTIKEEKNYYRRRLDVEKNGVLYLMNHDIINIYDFIRSRV